MKIKFLSLILVLFLFSGAFVFSACGNDGYNLQNLSSDFYSIANSNDDNIVKVGNNIEFNYAKHEYNNDKFLVDVIANDAPYTYLNNYNDLLYNIMSFTFSHISVCSTKEVVITEDESLRIKDEMSNFHKALKDVDSSVDMFAETIRHNLAEDTTSDICLESYRNLLSSYETLYQKAIIFNNSISNIYFNNLVKDSNPTIDLSARNIILKLTSRMKFQISNLSQSFAKTYVIGGDCSTKIAKESGSFEPTRYAQYKADVNLIKNANNSYSLSNLDDMLANATESNKTNFENYAVQAYNNQQIFNNNNADYIKAIKDINYVVSSENTEATAYEKTCVQTIDNYNNYVYNYTSVLINLVNSVL